MAYYNSRTYDRSTEAYQEARDAARETYLLFFGNVMHLIRAHSMCFEDLLRYFQGVGIKLGNSLHFQVRKGATAPHSNYYQFYCRAVRLDLRTLLMEEIEFRDWLALAMATGLYKLPEHLKPVCTFKAGNGLTVEVMRSGRVFLPQDKFNRNSNIVIKRGMITEFDPAGKWIRVISDADMAAQGILPIEMEGVRYISSAELDSKKAKKKQVV